MHNITLSMTFDSIEDLMAFVAANPGARDVKVASTQPSPSPVAAAPAPAPAAAPEAPAPTPEPASVDYSALRAQLTERLREVATSLGQNATEVGSFINGFGVARFSELPDDRLQEFASALDQKYPVAS